MVTLEKRPLFRRDLDHAVSIGLYSVSEAPRLHDCAHILSMTPRARMTCINFEGEITMKPTIHPLNALARTVSFYICLTLAVATSSFALDKVVTIQGPVELVTSNTDGRHTAYWVKDAQQVRYQIVLPDAEQRRFETQVRTSPAAVIKFDGTLVDNDQRTLNVNSWETITTTTTTSGALGNTQKTRSTTIVTK